MSFVFPDQIEVPKTPQLAYSTFRPCTPTPTSDPMFSLNFKKENEYALQKLLKMDLEIEFAQVLFSIVRNLMTYVNSYFSN